MRWLRSPPRQYVLSGGLGPGQDAAAAAELYALHSVDPSAGRAPASEVGLKLYPRVGFIVTNLTRPDGGYAEYMVAPVQTLAPIPDELAAVEAGPLRRSIQGWPSGVAADSEDTLTFSALSGVRPMIEMYPLERAADAYDCMMSGEARFRVVLEVRKSLRWHFEAGHYRPANQRRQRHASSDAALS